MIKGFTLIETAIVMSIAGIMLTTALTCYRAYIQREHYVAAQQQAKIDMLEKTIAEMKKEIQELRSSIKH